MVKNLAGFNLFIPYSGLLLRGPNICKICEHHLDSQKFLLVAKDLNVSFNIFYRKKSLML